MILLENAVFSNYGVCRAFSSHDEPRLLFTVHQAVCLDPTKPPCTSPCPPPKIFIRQAYLPTNASRINRRLASIQINKLSRDSRATNVGEMPCDPPPPSHTRPPLCCTPYTASALIMGELLPRPENVGGFHEHSSVRTRDFLFVELISIAPAKFGEMLVLQSRIYSSSGTSRHETNSAHVHAGVRKGGHGKD